ncbi:hypothetical protein [Lewinella sp. JB7]|uniref:hypothetical protein n=1 Tax=Lewinella sp. JB7 TaxID=2962887 RepID=UPI0020C9E8A7|nr:hypothetical protein [Lewinella sp. JB7]MCP9237170.1 hypothetical protein [Lewinella sp. JB7]
MGGKEGPGPEVVVRDHNSNSLAGSCGVGFLLTASEVVPDNSIWALILKFGSPFVGHFVAIFWNQFFLWLDQEWQERKFKRYIKIGLANIEKQLGVEGLSIDEREELESERKKLNKLTREDDLNKIREVMSKKNMKSESLFADIAKVSDDLSGVTRKRKR